jgi:hypothetical protein
VTIERLGYRLRDVFQRRKFDRRIVFQKHFNTANQLHESGFGQCDQMSESDLEETLRLKIHMNHEFSVVLALSLI